MLLIHITYQASYLAIAYLTVLRTHMLASSWANHLTQGLFLNEHVLYLINYCTESTRENKQAGWVHFEPL